MTSQRSLNSNARDFLRSMKEALLFPLIAFVMMLSIFVFPVMTYFSSESFKMVREHKEVLLFVTDSSISSVFAEAVPVFFVILGMLAAFKSFYFAMSKKQTNVYFSLGMSRNALYLNRLGAGALLFFAAAFIPLTVTFLLNLAKLGYSNQLLGVYLYFTSAFSVAGIAGLAIGSFAASVSGNIFEAALISGCTSFLPLMWRVSFTQFREGWLNGYTRRSLINSAINNMMMPYRFIQNPDFKENSGSLHELVSYPVRLLGSAADSDYGMAYDRPYPGGEEIVQKAAEIPRYLIIDRWWFLPVVIWLVASVLIALFGLYLFNRRKAEHANSFGHFPVGTAVVAMTAFLGAEMVLVEFLCYSDSYLWLIKIGLCIAPILAYFLIQLILQRKIKPVLKSLVLGAVLIGVCGFLYAFNATSYFGTYNKLPEKAEIESVQIDVRGGTGAFTHGKFGFGYSDPSAQKYLTSSDSKDIEMVTKVFTALSKEKIKKGEVSLTDVNITVNVKNGKAIERTFAVYSEDMYYDYMRSVYNSNYFDLLLKRLLADEPDPDFWGEDMDLNYYGGMFTSDPDHQQSLQTKEWTYFGNTFLADYSYGESKEITDRLENGEYAYDGEVIVDSEGNFVANVSDVYNGSSLYGVPRIGDTRGLCLALYADLKDMDFDAMYRNPSRPLGVLTTGVYSSVLDGNAQAVNYRFGGEHIERLFGGVVAAKPCVYLYPEMMNTLKFLKDNNIEPAPLEIGADKFTDKEIAKVFYTDSPLQFDAAAGEVIKSQTNYWNVHESDRFVMCSMEQMLGDAINLTEANYDSIAECVADIYKFNGHPLTAVTDEKKMNEIIEKSVPFYTTLGDNGRYVFVLYGSGMLVDYYLPEANLSVLK